MISFLELISVSNSPLSGEYFCAGCDYLFISLVLLLIYDLNT